MWLNRSISHHLGLILFFTLLSASFTSAATLLVHGDSLSAGYGINVEEGWVALLDAELGPDTGIVNSSISGETSRGGLARLPALLTEYQPDLLLLELGANDGLRGYPLTRLEDNLIKMIELAQEHNTRVILIGIRLPPNLGSRYTDPFFNLYRDLARRYSLLYLPFLLEGVAQYSDLMQPDGLHPTAEAQPIIRDNVLPLVQRALENPAAES